MTLRPEFPDLDEQNKRLSLVSNKTESVAKINKNKSLHSSKGNKPNGAILNKKKEKEEPNLIFGVYTPGQAREKLDEIWRLINNHGINPKVKRSMEDIMAKMLQSLEENDQLADKTEELYNIVIADAVKPTSFINQIKFEEFELDRFLYLSNTFVGRFGKALTLHFNADFGVVMVTLCIFISTFLCHVRFRTSAKFTTSCNIYGFIVGPPGCMKSPVAKEISKYTSQIITEFAEMAFKVDNFWVHGLKNSIQSSVCSLARNCQLTEQCSGIQTYFADELAQASQTFQFNKKADESEGIAFLTSGYDCTKISREFCDQRYHCEIERPYISTCILGQPELSQDLIIGGKAKMGFAARSVVAFANKISSKFGSVRYGDRSQITRWQSWVIENVLKASFRSLGTMLFCNFISDKSRLILKYSDECSLILIAFEWLMRKIRYDYQKLKSINDPNYDPDFCNSLVKGLTQIDKLNASLFFFNTFAEKPLKGTYKIDEDYYKKNVSNGPYKYYTFYIEDPTLVYGGMELLIDCKLNEADVKRKAAAGIDFNVSEFLLSPKRFACNGDKIGRSSSPEDTLDLSCCDVEDNDENKNDNDDDDIDSVKFSERLEKHQPPSKNIISLFLTIPGSHINISNIKSVIRVEFIKSKFPATWSDRFLFHKFVNYMKNEKKLTGYLDDIAATYHHKGLGLFVCKGGLGAKKLFIKPDIKKSFNFYLENVTAFYEDNAKDINLDDCIKKPLTLDILQVLYSVGVAGSEYIEQYDKPNIYNTGKNNSVRYPTSDEMEQQYKEKYSYDQAAKNQSLFKKHTNESGHVNVMKYHKHCWRNGRDQDDIHFGMYAMEYFYKKGQKIDNDDDDGDVTKDSDPYYYSPVRLSKQEKALPLRNLPSEIASFFATEKGIKVKNYYLNTADSVQNLLSKENIEIDVDLMEWAQDYEPIKDISNPNMLYKDAQQPASWNSRKPTKTPNKSK